MKKSFSLQRLINDRQQEKSFQIQKQKVNLNNSINQSKATQSNSFKIYHQKNHSFNKSSNEHVLSSQKNSELDTNDPSTIESKITNERYESILQNFNYYNPKETDKFQVKNSQKMIPKGIQALIFQGSSQPRNVFNKLIQDSNRRMLQKQSIELQKSIDSLNQSTQRSQSPPKKSHRQITEKLTKDFEERKMKINQQRLLKKRQEDQEIQDIRSKAPSFQKKSKEQIQKLTNKLIQDAKLRNQMKEMAEISKQQEEFQTSIYLANTSKINQKSNKIAQRDSNISIHDRLFNLSYNKEKIQRQLKKNEEAQQKKNEAAQQKKNEEARQKKNNEIRQKKNEEIQQKKNEEIQKRKNQESLQAKCEETVQKNLKERSLNKKSIQSIYKSQKNLIAQSQNDKPNNSLNNTITSVTSNEPQTEIPPRRFINNFISQSIYSQQGSPSISKEKAFNQISFSFIISHNKDNKAQQDRKQTGQESVNTSIGRQESKEDKLNKTVYPSNPDSSFFEQRQQNIINGIFKSQKCSPRSPIPLNKISKSNAKISVIKQQN